MQLHSLGCLTGALDETDAAVVVGENLVDARLSPLDHVQEHVCVNGLADLCHSNSAIDWVGRQTLRMEQEIRWLEMPTKKHEQLLAFNRRRLNGIQKRP